MGLSGRVNSIEEQGPRSAVACIEMARNGCSLTWASPPTRWPSSTAGARPTTSPRVRVPHLRGRCRSSRAAGGSRFRCRTVGCGDWHGGAVMVQGEACPGEQTAGGALDGPAVIPRRPHVAADASGVRDLVDVEHERPVPGCPRPRSGRRQREEDRLARPGSRPVQCVIERRWKMTPSRPILPAPRVPSMGAL